MPYNASGYKALLVALCHTRGHGALQASCRLLTQSTCCAHIVGWNITEGELGVWGCDGNQWGRFGEIPSASASALQSSGEGPASARVCSQGLLGQKRTRQRSLPPARPASAPRALHAASSGAPALPAGSTTELYLCLLPMSFTPLGSLKDPFPPHALRIAVLACCVLSSGEAFNQGDKQVQRESVADLEACARSMLLIPLGRKGLLSPLQVFCHLSPLGRVPCLPLLPGFLCPARMPYVATSGVNHSMRASSSHCCQPPSCPSVFQMFI